MTTYQLQNNGQPSDFAASVLWLLNDVDPSGPFWLVEQGLVAGNYGDRRWYWAENCGTTSQFHSLGAAALNEEHAIKTSYNGGGKYAFYRDGDWKANSGTCHQSTALRLETGGETTTGVNWDYGQSRALQKRAAGSTSWSYVWPGSTLEADAPMTSGWYTQDQYLWWFQ